jgi:hypothetical protein
LLMWQASEGSWKASLIETRCIAYELLHSEDYAIMVVERLSVRSRHFIQHHVSGRNTSSSSILVSMIGHQTFAGWDVEIRSTLKQAAHSPPTQAVFAAWCATPKGLNPLTRFAERDKMPARFPQAFYLVRPTKSCMNH